MGELTDKQMKENKIVYDAALDLHKHIFEQLKFAETKINILLSINLALFSFCVSFVVSNGFKDQLIDLASLLFFIPLGLALYFIFRALRPRIDNAEDIKKRCVQENLYYFQYLCSISSDEILRQIKEKTSCATITNEAQIKDLSNQIHILSSIISNKHHNFIKSVRWLYIFVVLCFALFVFRSGIVVKFCAIYAKLAHILSV